MGLLGFFNFWEEMRSVRKRKRFLHGGCAEKTFVYERITKFFLQHTLF